LTVSARDGGGLSAATNASVTVHILQTTLAPAIFERYQYAFSLPEDAPEDSLVGTVKAREPPDSLEVVSYRISSGDPQGRFCIDSQFGIIRIKKELDHETQSAFVLTIQSQLGKSPVYSSAQVNISVIDVNDNPPVFLTGSSKVIIPCTQPPGTAIYIAHAEDKDSSLNGAIKYSLASNQSDTFSIDPSLGVVSLTRTVFEDKQLEYTLHIAAEDHGSPPLSSLLLRDSLTAKIVILDINDNIPSFVSSPLCYVMENAEVGLLVHRITAKDPDEGRNGHVTYHIVSGNENGSFILDKITGLLSTAQPLDREVQEHYSLTVMALDDGSPALSTTQVLAILVLDVNDVRPIFLQELYETAVYENQDPGELVIRVEAVDGDTGHHSLLQYEILPGPGYEKFRINSDSGELVTAVSLDRETQEVFSIKGSPSRSSTALLYITVLDENDHSPLFETNQYHISVREDLEEGTAILDLFASDEDDGPNGEVMYSLIDDTFGAFAIDSVTGSIVTTKVLDRETKSHYTFRAVASDCSIHFLRSATATLCGVTVLIQDVNDNLPIFEQSSYKASVWEGQTPTTDIIQIFATDLDSGLNGETEYSIVSGNENGTFLIDSARGTLATNTILNHENTSSYRETAASHHLVLLASDRGKPSLNSTATVLITVLDVNDNPPVFSSPEYHIHIKESIPVGSHVTEVSADDLDAGTNAEITYAIISGNDKQCFRLDGKTGSVDLMKTLDYEDTMKFTLLIQAT
ncbi:PCD23 protein, partial [Penelope pileata]|nr:PCD23 protein [Penelope pileata]